MKKRSILATSVVRELLTKLKQRYGVPQNAVAEALGISAQALADIKSGRRRFTPRMSEKLLQQYKAEPWADWLARVLRPAADPDQGELLSNEEAKTAASYFPSAGAAWEAMKQAIVPLLPTPCLGSPELSAAYRGEKVMLPEWAVKLIPPDSDPYVLELDADDYAGELRMGDQVLIVHRIQPAGELAVVNRGGCPRLARNSSRAPAGTAVTDWIALDSGFPIRGAVPVAAIVGIVMARR